MTQLINLYLKDQHDIVLVCRDENKQRFLKTITDHRPYMYIEDKDGKYKGLFEEKLKKLVYTAPYDVSNNRDKYPKTWESDIHYTNRVLIDKVNKITKTAIRILYFDIETAFSNGKSSEENPLDPITCLTALDSFSGKTMTFVWHPNMDKYKLLLKEKFGKEITCFDNEKFMIETFIIFLNYLDSDILTGWNSNNFDLMYMMNRCKMLKIDFDKISMSGKIKFRKYPARYGMDETEWNIDGRYAFDMLRAYRQLTSHELDSYTLNDVARKELKDEKIEIEESFKDLWNNDIVKLVEYNRKDTLLLKLLNEKLDLEIIDTFNERRIEFGCDWADLWQTTKWQDMVFLREYKNKICLPRKPQYKKGKKKQTIAGGYVHDSKPGLHHNVIVLDLENMYPAIMISFNMSPETIDEKGILNVGNGVRFRDDKVGVVPQVLLKYRNLRKMYEIQRDKAEQEKDKNKYKLFQKKRDNAKLAGNSLYGAMKQYFRLSDIRIAGSVTHIGQETIKWTAKVVESHKGEIIDKFKLPKCEHIYSDTDSCFIELGNGNLTKKQLIEIGNYIVDLINKSYDDFAKQYGIKKHYFNIELEEKKLFSSLFFGVTSSTTKGEKNKGAKKRYCGYLK